MEILFFEEEGEVGPEFYFGVVCLFRVRLRRPGARWPAELQANALRMRGFFLRCPLVAPADVVVFDG